MIAPPRPIRRRWVSAVGVAAVICLGLAARSSAVGLPPFVAKYGADALWAVMVFVGIGFAFPSWPTGIVAALAAVVSCAVEFSQIYHAPWIDAIRRTTLGHLVLGDTFAWSDIAAYLIGIAGVAAAEWLAKRIESRRHTNRDR